MSHEIDLRRLAELSGPDRAFLSIYLTHPSSLEALPKRLKNCRALLAGNKDEIQHFEENLALLDEWIERQEYEHGSVCVFACWALDFFEVHPVQAPLPDIVRVDSSPYLRPLSELLDEYENYLVVVADNTRTQIYLTTAEATEEEDTIKGGIKNHVRKGGWSQQRYERRRDKALHHYAKQIAESIQQVADAEAFRRILLVGSKETIQEIEKVLPANLQKLVTGTKAVDLSKGDAWVDKEVYELFVSEERHSEEVLWERIQAEYLRGGLAVVGIHAVLEAAQNGRVDTMIVHRDYKATAQRCRDCEHLDETVGENCSACGSASVFEVDLIEEVVEHLLKTSADVDYVDPIPALAEVGEVAALLRY